DRLKSQLHWTGVAGACYGRRAAPTATGKGTTMSVRLAAPTLAAVLALLAAAPRPAPAETCPAACEPPAWLPRYDLDIDLAVPAHRAVGRLWATWTNPQPRPTDHLEFNAHSRYVVPDGQVGLMAKTLEILRGQAGEVLGEHDPAFDLQRVVLETGPDHPPVELP